SALVSFFFCVTPSLVLYPLSLHDALPIFRCEGPCRPLERRLRIRRLARPHSRRLAQAMESPLWRAFSDGRRDHRLDVARVATRLDRKSTRLNSSHVKISYAVFCLKKKTKQ